MKSIITASALLSLAHAWGPGHGGEPTGWASHGGWPPQHSPPPGQPPHGPPHGYPPYGYPPHGPPPGYGPGHCVSSVAANELAGSETITADEIRAMGNNSLFTRWRPYAHVNAPAGWMNDPCGPMYDPTRDIYHIFYQWHPNHINWGNISWGYATSKDLITWTDHKGWQNNEALAIGPTGNGSYNGLGIFSGTAQPVNLQGEVDGTLLLMYTSVSYLPTNFRIDYHPYTETQSFAISTDGGETFSYNTGSPVIDATRDTAPMYWNITGFRDPFYHSWSELDALLEKSEPHYYAVFGSGIKGADVNFGVGTINGYVGPRIPLWSAPSSNLHDWTFEGALWEPLPNTTLGTYLSTGSYGYNFEVSNFFSLKDSQGNDRYFVTMGAEGGNLTFHQSGHWSLWNMGTVTRRANGSAEFHPMAGGSGDWGLGYALTSFNDTKNNRRIQWNWVEEDLVGDGGIFSATQQGFQGSLAIPQELFVHETQNVVVTSELLAAKSAMLSADSGVATAYTLGKFIPADILGGMRSCSKKKTYASGKQTAPSVLDYGAGSAYEFSVTITSTTGAAGVRVQASPSGEEYTDIMYEPSNNTILVDRSHSSLVDEFNNATVTGFFYPYQISGSGTEPIVMDIFVDGSLIEIHINNRFLLSTRVYTANYGSTGFGLYVASGASAQYTDVFSYIGLARTWPGRPENSSSALVFDTPEETNDYIWWSGN